MTPSKMDLVLQKVKWLIDNKCKLSYEEWKIYEKSELAATLCYEDAYDKIMRLRSNDKRAD